MNSVLYELDLGPPPPIAASPQYGDIRLQMLFITEERNWTAYTKLPSVGFVAGFLFPHALKSSAVFGMIARSFAV